MQYVCAEAQNTSGLGLCTVAQRSRRHHYRNVRHHHSQDIANPNLHYVAANTYKRMRAPLRIGYKPISRAKERAVMTYRPPVSARHDTQNREALNADYILPENSDEEVRYILTLDTDQPIHERMTELRKKYFPPFMNKTPGHLTLFHALPGSRLESTIVPDIEELASRTSAFTLRAGLPFRMKTGFAVPVTRKDGGNEAQSLHDELRRPWQDVGFLTIQDQRSARLHWTIMNKVTDEAKVDKAFNEVSDHWNGPYGQATGLRLWRYESDGHWTNQRLFPFKPSKS